MKRAQVQRLTKLPPQQRALEALKLGAELARQRPKRYPQGLQPGLEPLCFHEDLVGAGVPFLRELHGVGREPMAKIPGIKQIGDIRVQRRRVEDRVMITRKLNEQRRKALKSKPGETVADVAERQLLLTLMDAAPATRLCAAYAYWQATQATHVALPILAKGLESKDLEELDIAATALGKMGRAGASRLRPHVGTAADDRPNSPVHQPVASLTVLIHGTFAMNRPWYQPGGDFHSYLKQEVYPDLYGGSDFFFWSGRYTDRARRAAAEKLVTWCAEHPAGLLRLVAHSHGANVVNLATRMGLKACTLIHLSPPVHDEYLPAIANVSSQRFFTIRPRIDLVVALDGGDHDYRNTPLAPFERRRICAFSGHSKSHQRNPWKKKNVPALVKTVCP